MPGARNFSLSSCLRTTSSFFSLLSLPTWRMRLVSASLVRRSKSFSLTSATASLFSFISDGLASALLTESPSLVQQLNLFPPLLREDAVAFFLLLPRKNFTRHQVAKFLRRDRSGSSPHNFVGDFKTWSLLCIEKIRKAPRNVLRFFPGIEWEFFFPFMSPPLVFPFF